MAHPVRVVQISDTHLSAAAGPPPQWRRLLERLRADPPDLVVHTGDIVLEDPDDEADRAFARSLLDQVPVPLEVIPGNHDVGFYGDAADLPRRLEAFVATHGSDRFARELGAWRLVGVDAYLLGRDDPLGRAHHEWFAAALDVDRPIVVFVHQPPLRDRTDGWQMPQRASVAFGEAVAGRDVRLVASGHRHCAARWTVDGRPTVWAPSLTLVSRASARWLAAPVTSRRRPGSPSSCCSRRETSITPPWCSDRRRRGAAAGPRRYHGRPAGRAGHRSASGERRR